MQNGAAVGTFYNNFNLTIMWYTIPTWFVLFQWTNFSDDNSQDQSAFDNTSIITSSHFHFSLTHTISKPWLSLQISLFAKCVDGFRYNVVAKISFPTLHAVYGCCIIVVTVILVNSYVDAQWYFHMKLCHTLPFHFCWTLFCFL